MAIALSELTNTTLANNTDAVATAETDVRAGPTTLIAVYVTNIVAATVVYLKFYDNADPTIGTTEPDEVYEIEGSAGGNAGHTRILVNGLTGLAFANALSYAVVTDGGGTAGTTPPGGSDNVLVDLVTT